MIIPTDKETKYIQDRNVDMYCKFWYCGSCSAFFFLVDIVHFIVPHVNLVHRDFNFKNLVINSPHVLLIYCILTLRIWVWMPFCVSIFLSFFSFLFSFFLSFFFTKFFGLLATRLSPFNQSINHKSIDQSINRSFDQSITIKLCVIIPPYAANQTSPNMPKCPCYIFNISWNDDTIIIKICIVTSFQLIESGS